MIKAAQAIPSAAHLRLMAGFTLIELVVVMLLLGVLTAWVSMRASTTDMDVITQAEQLAADIRYTQSLSMSRGQRYRVNFTASSYLITDMSGAAQAHPGTGLRAPISLGTTVLSGYNPTLTNNYVAFNSSGVPYISATAILAGVATLTLTGSGNTNQVSVAPDTGRVKLQ